MLNRTTEPQEVAAKVTYSVQGYPRPVNEGAGGAGFVGRQICP